MPNVAIKIDTRALADLGDKFERAARAGLVRTLELGEQYLRQEAPERTGLLRGKKGNNSISSDYRQTSTGFEGEFIVSAISERRGTRKATLHLPSGTTKSVSLAPQPQFDYAEAVARGRKEIRPRKARALLIGVSSAPTGEVYITDGAETFIIRPRAKAQKPNPYDERAANRLEKEVEPIFQKSLADFGLLS